MLQKWSCNFHSNCQKTLWTPIDYPLMFLKLDTAKTIGQNFFFTRKIAFFFQNFVFSTTCLVLQKWSCNLNCIWQNTLWTLKYCTLRFVTLDSVRKNTPKSFIYWKLCVFFKNFCFQQPLRCFRNDLVTSAAIVKIPCGPFQSVPWGLSLSVLPEKIGQNLFSTGKFAFSSENCVYNNLLGPKEMIL